MFLSLWTTVMGAKGPMRLHSRISCSVSEEVTDNTELLVSLGIIYKLSDRARSRSVGICLVINFFLKKHLSLLLENWFDLGIAFAGLFCTYPKEVRPCRPIAIWTHQTSNGVLQLKEQPKIK